MTNPMNDKLAIESLLADMPALADDTSLDLAEAPPVAPRPARDLSRMMRKIPVTLTLEVGSARVSLAELMEIGAESVVELDTLAGEPLIIKVNGTPIGRAEVVVSGENYGLKVIDLEGLDLGSLGS